MQEAGVGEYCVDSLLTDIESLGLFSSIHRFILGFIGCWRAVSHLAFIYREHGDETQVFAVLDLRRNPNWIRKELKKRDQ
jgi:hypothetical protein